MHLADDRDARIPPLPTRYVARDRLLGALDDATAHPLTLVAAGPGAGKTVLLSAWARQAQPAPVWVSLTAQHDHPTRFWRYLLRAVRAAGVVVDEDVERDGDTHADLDLDSGIDPAGSRLMTRIAAAVAAQSDQPLVIIFDDAHELRSAAVLRGLEECIGSMGGQIRLVVAARTDPDLPLHRYRLSGDVAELRATDLAMTPAEVSDLLAAYEVSLPPREFALLCARTEGWTAGVRLSAMRMEGAPNPGEFVTEFALDHGSVGEYLTAEVLNRLPDEMRLLLIETSFLDEVNASLAQAVTGRADAAELLAELARTNAFVIGAAPGGAVRYHELLREILRYLLRREPEDRVALLRLRAARWYADAGDVGHALRFAAEAGDVAFLARVLVHGGFARALEKRLELAAVRSVAFDADGADDAERVLRLTAAAAINAWNGRHLHARGRLDRLAEVTGAPAADAADPHLATTVALCELLIARAQRDPQAAERWAGELTTSSGAGLAAVTRFELAMTNFYSGRHEPVAALLTTAAAEASAASAAALEADCLAELAHVTAFWSRQRESRGWEVRAERVLRSHPSLVAPPALLLGAAERALGHGDLSGALTILHSARHAVSGRPASDVLGEISLVEAFVLLSMGRHSNARALLAHLEASEPGLLWSYRAAGLASIETALGRPNAAVRMLLAEPAPASPSVADVALGRAFLASGSLDDAAEALRPVLTTDGEPSLQAVYVDALLTDAEIDHARGVDEARIAYSLQQALDRADDNFVLPFLMLQAPLASVPSRHPDLGARWPTHRSAPSRHTMRVRPAGTDSPHRPDTVLRFETDALLGEPLSERERAVLRWLSTSMSVNEIGDELCLSPNTVKSHVASIYRKLGVAGRRDAVARARAAELL